MLFSFGYLNGMVSSRRSWSLFPTLGEQHEPGLGWVLITNFSEFSLEDPSWEPSPFLTLAEDNKLSTMLWTRKKKCSEIGLVVCFLASSWDCPSLQGTVYIFLYTRLENRLFLLLNCRSLWLKSLAARSLSQLVTSAMPLLDVLLLLRYQVASNPYQRHLSASPTPASLYLFCLKLIL
jgi:hypothetical protein